MARSHAIVRQAFLGVPSASAAVSGVAASVSPGGLSTVASPRRIPTGVQSVATRGTIIGLTPESLLSVTQPSPVVEPASGTTPLTYTISRAADGYGAILFDVDTTSGTATEGLDYVGVHLANQTISAGQSIDVVVTVNSDAITGEGTEVFDFNVHNCRFA